jgi:hypothetical protein
VPRRPRLTFQDNALLDPTKQAALLDQIKSMGGTGIQQDVVWGNVRKNGGYDPAAIQALQALAQAANQRGIRPQFRLMGTPYYQQQHQPGVDTTLSATNPNATVMRQFATDMAKTFGGQVSKYSVWDEPNVHSFLMQDNPATAARTYRGLYEAAYQGIKQANPNAKVGLGEITSGDPKATGAASSIGFLKQILAGKNLRADYVAVHPYQWSNPAQHPKGMDPGFAGISNLGAVNQVIRQAYSSGRLRTATGKRPGLSLSEYGYKTDAVPNAHTRSAWLRKSMQEAQQAGVSDVNLYQLVPSKKGDYWDSTVPGEFRSALKKMRGRSSF